jgi:hypothetical protein
MKCHKICTNFTFNECIQYVKHCRIFSFVCFDPLASWRNFVCPRFNDVTRTITCTIQKVLFNMYIYIHKIILTFKYVTIWVKMIILLLDCYNHQQQQVFHHHTRSSNHQHQQHLTSHTRSSNHQQQQSLTSHTRSSNYQQQQSLHHTPEARRKKLHFTYFIFLHL